MKKQMMSLAVCSAFAVASQAALWVDSITTSPDLSNSEATTLLTYTVGANTYNVSQTASSVSGLGADLTGTWQVWGQNSTMVSVSNSLVDTYLDTGVLGSTAIDDARYHFSTALTGTENVFVFMNAGGQADEINTITAYDSGGTMVGSAISLNTAGELGAGAWDGAALAVDQMNLSRFRASDTNSAALNNRNILGFSVNLSEFGGDASTITAIQMDGVAANVDYHLVGVGVIPEPATLGLIGVFGGAMLFIRRRFMI